LRGGLQSRQTQPLVTGVSRILELLQKHQVSVVSVTQLFSTANSMGRLILNLLLSFDQFERATHHAAGGFPPSLARNHPRDRHPYQRIPVLQAVERSPFMSRQTPRAVCQEGINGIRSLSHDFGFWYRTLDILTVLHFAIQFWQGDPSMSKHTNPTTRKMVSPLMVRLDAESKQVLADAAELRRISVSDYVRTVTVAQARREVASAREQTVLLSPDEQLAFWRALQAPPKLTPAQKRLGAIMRGAK